MNTPSVSSGALSRFRKGIIAGLLLLAAGTGVFYRVWRAGQPGGAGQAEETAARREELAQRAMDAFLEDGAEKLLNQAQQKDIAAVQRAIAALDARFRAYRSGIEAFTGALTGWGMRSKIIYRETVETIEGKDRHSWTAALVREQFEMLVMSDVRLEADVMEVLRQFAYDMEADRNEFLASLESGLSALPLPAPVRTSLERKSFQEPLKRRIGGLLNRLPGQSVAAGAGSITAGIVAEEAARQLIRGVVTQAASRLVTGAAVSGGTAAGAVAGGGAGGTAVAPGIGTLAGVAGGLVVGAVVDWWMTDEFKEKVSAQCEQFLRETRNALVSGDRGLETVLLQQVTQNYKACRSALNSLHSSADDPGAGPLP